MDSLRFVGQLVFLLIGLAACTNSNQALVDSMETRIAELEKSRDTTTFRLDLLEEGSTTGYFEPSSKGFMRIDSSTGSFLVSLDDLKPYANGYKATFRIGNPSSAAYSGTIVKAKWGPGYRNQEARAAGAKDHETEQTISKTLEPGSWNSVTVILAPAEKSEIERITIKLDTPSVLLRR